MLIPYEILAAPRENHAQLSGQVPLQYSTVHRVWHKQYLGEFSLGSVIERITSKDGLFHPVSR